MNSQVTPITLHPSKNRLILLMLGCIVFSLASFLLIKAEKSLGWFGLAFFGLGTLLQLIQMLPGANALTLTTDGFLQITLFRKKFTRWEDVTAFHVDWVNRREQVCYNFTRPRAELGFNEKFAQDVYGWDAAIANQFDMPVEELARLLNEWRFMALAARQG